VLTATNGVEAFLQVKRWQPKAVILDLFMPRLGGIGALGRIKALNPEVVVILVSGMGNALELVTEAGLSVAGAFTKPLNLMQLSETLARSGVVAPEALRRIKTSAPETCVIMVTAVEDIDSARGALALGASDYVTKPFSFQYLDSVLEVHMLMDHIDPKSS